MERELEVKILGIDLDKLESKIVELGGKLIANEEQINTIIDSKKSPIKSYIDAYLRIRETKDLLNNRSYTNLNLKKNVNMEGIRENIELSTELQDKDMMLEIFKNLGFDDTQIGYKERKSYELNGARLDLDRWDEKTYPFPYMEIEVESRRHLNEIISLLGVPQANISTKSIVELKNELKLL